MGIAELPLGDAEACSGGRSERAGNSLLESATLRWGALAGVIALASGATFWLQTLYANQQRQNMRELSDFLTRYLGMISNRFREASATASRVIQGDERDSKKLGAAAQKSHKVMIWLGFRPFFIETFVRNINFQMRRNLGY
jgi:hypothetical protein